MADRFSGKAASLAILCAGYCEAVIGVLQLAGIMHSRHPDYAFTGTFYNPGPYACFLAIVFPVALHAIMDSRHRHVRWMGMGYAAVCALLIPATLSRTAIAACLAGGALALCGHAMPYARKLKPAWILTGTVIIAAAAAGLYAIKQDSADGRLLMWKVAAQAAADGPLTGTGWDYAAGAYGEAQERYFASGKGSDREIMVADAPEYAFNEYLQTAIAFGLPAALAMTAIMAGGVTAALRNGSHGLAGSATAAAAVMTGSYPLQFTESVILICLVYAGCYLSSSSRAIRIAGCGAVCGCGALFLANNDRTDVRTAFATALALHRQHEYRKSNDMLLDLKQKSADPMILNIIGKNHQAMGMPDSAIFYLEKSARRCPNRMYPHYLLMRLYNDSAIYDAERLRREAETIATMRVKVESDATRDMQREANAIIMNKAKTISRERR